MLLGPFSHIISFDLHHLPLSGVLVFLGNRSPERISDLPKIAQVLGGQGRR